MFASPGPRPVEANGDGVAVCLGHIDSRPQLASRLPGSTASSHDDHREQDDPPFEHFARSRSSGLTESPAKSLKRLANALPRLPESVKRPLGNLSPSAPRKRRPATSMTADGDSSSLPYRSTTERTWQPPLAGGQSFEAEPFSPIPVRPYRDLPTYLNDDNSDDVHIQYAGSSTGPEPVTASDEPPPTRITSFSRPEFRQARPSGLVCVDLQPGDDHSHRDCNSWRSGLQGFSASPTQTPVQTQRPSVFVLPNPQRPYLPLCHAHPGVPPRSSTLTLSRASSLASRAPSPARSAASHSSGRTANIARYDYSPVNSNWSLSVSTSWSFDSPAFYDAVECDPDTDRPQITRSFSEAVRALDELVDGAFLGE